MRRITLFDAKVDFAFPINIYSEIGYVLKHPKTIMNTPGVIIFSENVSELFLDVTYITCSENISAYIENHQDEALHAKYIIILPVNEPSFSFQEEMNFVKIKFQKITDMLLMRPNITS